MHVEIQAAWVTSMRLLALSICQSLYVEDEDMLHTVRVAPLNHVQSARMTALQLQQMDPATACSWCKVTTS